MSEEPDRDHTSDEDGDDSFVFLGDEQGDSPDRDPSITEDDPGTDEAAGDRSDHWVRGGGGDASGTDDDPLSGLARDVADRRASSAVDDDVFEEMAVGAVDDDALWDDILEGDGERIRPPGALTEEETVAVGDSGVPEHVVPKRTYCQRCRYFSSPPSVACQHEGTEILALVDVDHFRVRNCPMVESDEPLE